MKIYSTLSRLALIVLSTHLLVGCDNMLDASSPWKKGDAQPPQKFNEPHFLCEVKTMLPDTGEGVYVADENGPCSPWDRDRLPSFADFQVNPGYWQAWHRSMGIQYRVLGIVDHTVSYHPTKVIIRGKTRTEYITIDSGPYAGTKAEFRK